MSTEKREIEYETEFPDDITEEDIEHLESPLDRAAARVAVRRGWLKLKDTDRKEASS